MGTQYRVTCRHCGTLFKASNGDGFAFHLLHCERCGAEQAITDQQIGTMFRADPPAVDAWIAANVRPRRCSGRLTLDAKAQCPKCKSGDWDHDNAESEIDYD